MDRIGANFFRTVDMIVDRLGAQPLVIHLPIGTESDFVGLVDLIQMKAIRWKDETMGAEYVIEDIPADLQAQAADYRARLVETAVEQDDAALEAWRALPGVESVRRDNGLVCLNVREPHLTIPALLEAVTNEGEQLLHLTTRQASLEDVFVRLTGRHLREE